MSTEIVTFGCRLNAYESEAIRARAAEAHLENAFSMLVEKAALGTIQLRGLAELELHVLEVDVTVLRRREGIRVRDVERRVLSEGWVRLPRADPN